MGRLWEKIKPFTGIYFNICLNSNPNELFILDLRRFLLYQKSHATFKPGAEKLNRDQNGFLWPPDCDLALKNYPIFLHRLST